MLGGFSVLFEAPLEKVKIVTDDSGGLRLRPQENEETKQIVIIKKNGKVRVKRYSYRLEINGDRKFFDRTFKFDEEITNIAKKMDISKPEADVLLFLYK